MLKAGWWGWLAQITVTTGSFFQPLSVSCPPHLFLSSLLSTSLNPMCLTWTWWSPIPFTQRFYLLSCSSCWIITTWITDPSLCLFGLACLFGLCLLVWTLHCQISKLLDCLFCRQSHAKRVQIRSWYVEHKWWWASRHSRDVLSVFSDSKQLSAMNEWMWPDSKLHAWVTD